VTDLIGNVLVTGANSGLGRATAAALAGVGYRVYAGMRSIEKAEKLLGLVQGASGEVQPIELDVTNDASVAGAFEQIHSQTGPLDILINNAGIGYNAAVEDVDIEAAKLTFDTNYWGVIRCIKAALPGMRKSERGHIINISSVAGRIAALGQTVYSSSKWALECLSENLVQEVATFGIRVSVIEPGVTRTAILPKNIGHPEPTVYETPYRRMLQFYQKGIEANAEAGEVAATILTAIRDADPKFRYACAWSGPEIAARRPEMSDADWIALGLASNDEDYYEKFEQIFGLDLRT
jgi:NAD(P)-dependent dehydrogenase (short-subunit alcohol dehydrogenase family)